MPTCPHCGHSWSAAQPKRAKTYVDDQRDVSAMSDVELFKYRKATAHVGDARFWIRVKGESLPLDLHNAAHMLLMEAEDGLSRAATLQRLRALQLAADTERPRIDEIEFWINHRAAVDRWMLSRPTIKKSTGDKIKLRSLSQERLNCTGGEWPPRRLSVREYHQLDPARVYAYDYQKEN